jgi:hypothetical protein
MGSRPFLAAEWGLRKIFDLRSAILDFADVLGKSRVTGDKQRTKPTNQMKEKP